ncbi:hypothetical protein QUH73_19775 [Labilibaculum sp. K2S]|uniref:hypothetical protein n=1 Tax=Labilibaculum sp. K2S TaxID=3056386 RepID=UPI0025A47875|nr:hypothetical protein [Labilibaculum sp. K2S]MDM8162067.1 hypothetical protein [Labilibaculum sp. K2S]
MNKNNIKKTGLIILTIGVIMTIFTTFSFFTKENVLDIGDVQITRDQQHKVKWPPFIGLTVIGLGGIVLILAIRKK